MQPPDEGQPRPPQPPYYPPPGQQQYGPPPGQYPQQQPYYPQQPPPKRKRRRWPIFLLIGALLLCVIVGVAVATSPKPTSTTTTTGGSSATTPATTAPTKASTPAAQLKWTTTRTFTGNGTKKTGTFPIGDDWRMNWTCNPASFQNLDYNVIITVYNSDGSLSDTGVNATCKKGSVSGSTEVHTSGTVYLDIVSEGDWSIQIQELK